MISGEGFPVFKTVSDVNQQNLIWLASCLADEVASAGYRMAETRA